MPQHHPHRSALAGEDAARSQSTYAAAPRVPTGLATAAISLALAWSAYRVLLAAMSYGAVDVWVAGAEQGLVYAEVPWTGYDTVGRLAFPLQVALYVVACLWLYRSRKVADAINPRWHHRRRALWVWLGWWVPVVALWFPFQVVRDIRQATIRGAMAGRMGLWWTCWLLPLVLDRFMTSMLGGALGWAPISRDVASYPYLETAAAALTAVACWLWVSYIRELTAAQRTWAARQA